MEPKIYIIKNFPLYYAGRIFHFTRTNNSQECEILDFKIHCPSITQVVKCSEYSFFTNFIKACGGVDVCGLLNYTDTSLLSLKDINTYQQIELSNVNDSIDNNETEMQEIDNREISFKKKRGRKS